MTENESMHPDIQFTHQIKVCYYLKASKAQKKNMCVYYLMKILNRVGRSIFFFIFFFIFYFISNRVGRSGRFFFFTRFFFSLDFFPILTTSSSIRGK